MVKKMEMEKEMKEEEKNYGKKEKEDSRWNGADALYQRQRRAIITRIQKAVRR